MKRATVALIAAASLAIVVSGIRAGAGSAGRDLPAGSFRASVQEVMRDDEILVCRVEIEARRGTRVLIVSDRPDRGGLTTVVPNPARADHPPPVVRLTAFGDHLRWRAGQVAALKFVLDLSGGPGRAALSQTGPMPPGREKLADAVSIALKPGVYREGSPTELVTLGDTTYSVVVGEAHR